MVEVVIILFIVWLIYSFANAQKRRVDEKVEPFVGSAGNRATTIKKVANKQPKRSSVPHKKQMHLGSKTERNFYQVLQEILPSDYVVHCQVSLMALVQPVNFKDNSRTWAKRMDYVITDRATKVIAVIELDDSSHRQRKRIERDLYVKAVLEGHHKLLRFEARGKYDRRYVIQVIERETEINCNVPSDNETQVQVSY